MFNFADYLLFVSFLVFLFLYHIFSERRQNQIRNQIQNLGNLTIRDIEALQRETQKSSEKIAIEVEKKLYELGERADEVRKIVSDSHQLTEIGLRLRGEIQLIEDKTGQVQLQLSEVQELDELLLSHQKRGEELEQRLKSAQKEQRSIDENLRLTSEKMDSEKERLSQESEKRAKAIQQELESHGENFSSLQEEMFAQRARLDQFSQEIGFLGHELDERKEQLGERIDQAMSGLTAELKRRETESLEALNVRMEEHLQETERELYAKWGKLYDQPHLIEQWQKEWNGHLKRVEKDQNEELTTLKNRIISAEGEIFEKITQQIDEFDAKTTRTLESRQTQFDTLLSDQEKQLHTLHNENQQKISSFRGQLERIAQQIDGERQSTTERLKGQKEFLSSWFDENVVTFRETWQEKLDSNQEKISKHFEATQNRLQEEQTKLSNETLGTLEKHLEGNVQWLESRIDESERNLQNKVRSIINVVKDEYNNFFETRKTTFESMVSTFETTKGSLIDKYETMQTKIKTQLTTLEEETGTAEKRVVDLTDSLEREKNQLVSNFNNELDLTRENLNQIKSEITQVSQISIEKIESKIEILTTDIERQKAAIKSLGGSEIRWAKIEALQANFDSLWNLLQERQPQIEDYGTRLDSLSSSFLQYQESFESVTQLLQELSQQENDLSLLSKEVKEIRQEGAALKEQAQYFSDLKIDLHSGIEEHQSVISAIEEYRKERDSFQQQIENAQGEQNKLSKVVEELRTESGQLDGLHKQIEEILKNKENLLENQPLFLQLKEELSAGIEEHESVISTIEEYRKERDSFQQQIENAQGEQSKLLTVVEELRSERGELDDLHKQIEEILKNKENLLENQPLFLQLKEELSAGIEEHDQVLNQIRLYRKEREGFEDHLARGKSQEEHLRGVIDELDSRQDELSDIQSGIGSVRALNTKLTQSYEKLMNEHESLFSSLEEAQKAEGRLTQIQTASERVKEVQAWIATVEERMFEMQNKIKSNLKVFNEVATQQTSSARNALSPPTPTDKEYSVLELSKKGWSQNEIAKTLSMSASQVEMILKLNQK